MSQADSLAVFRDILGAAAPDSHSDIKPDTTFTELGLDSLTTLEVIVAAEDRFGLIIADDDWPQFKTISDAIAYVEGAAVAARLPVA